MSGESEIPFKHGETVSGVWHGDVGDLLECHLGIVDKIDDNGEYIYRMKRSDKQRLFLGEADI